MLEHDPLIAEYSHERFRPREAEALRTLQRVASVVKPIMRQRNWKVGTLKEFYPDQQNLLGLNVNRGESICLRLRYPTDERQFLPFEDVVDTMLHELCHIVHGPHNEAFHKLWDQLRDEHESLVRKGYTGEGFLGKGQKLGGQRIPMQEARRRARAAAEQRRSFAAGSGQRLGGAPILRSQDIRSVIVNAIERRNSITNGCASESADKDQIIEQTTRNGFRTKAEEDDANERAIAQAYMELVQEEQREKYGKDYIEPSQIYPTGSRDSLGYLSGSSSMPPPPVPSHNKPSPKQPALTDYLPPSSTSSTKSVNDSWTCGICTLHNPAEYLCCDACGTERSSAPFSDIDVSSQSHPIVQPLQAVTSSSSSDSKNPIPKSSIREDRKLRSSRSKQALRNYSAWSEVVDKKPLGWVCERCGNFTESEFWSCSSCGTIKSRS